MKSNLPRERPQNSCVGGRPEKTRSAKARRRLSFDRGSTTGWRGLLCTRVGWRPLPRPGLLCTQVGWRPLPRPGLLCTRVGWRPLPRPRQVCDTAVAATLHGAPLSPLRPRPCQHPPLPLRTRLGWSSPGELRDWVWPWRWRCSAVGAESW